MIKSIIQIIILVLLIFVVSVSSWFWLERINVLNTSYITDIVSDITRGNEPIEEIALVDDSLLIDKIRLEKQAEEIAKERKALSEERQELESKSIELAETIATLETARNQLEEQQKNFNENQKQFDDKNERVRVVAESLMNMPPASAVEILSGFDDVLLIDTLLVVNSIAAEQGTASVVPFWFSLMDAKRASLVQTKIVELTR